jgi:hypothetical protein
MPKSHRRDSKRLQLFKKSSARIFEQFDYSGDGVLSEFELNKGLLAQHVYVARSVTKKICAEIRNVSPDGNITVDAFANYMNTAKPASSAEHVSIILRSTFKQLSFWLVLAFSFGGFINTGRIWFWVSADEETKVLSYKLVGWLNTLGCFGFIMLNFTHATAMFDRIEHTRLQLKSEIIEQIGGGEKLASKNWSQFIFDAADTDHDGSIGLVELWRIFEGYGMLCSPEILRYIFGRIDKRSRKDGNVTPSELEEYITKLKPASAAVKDWFALKTVLTQGVFYALLCLLLSCTTHLIISMDWHREAWKKQLLQLALFEAIAGFVGLFTLMSR